MTLQDNALAAYDDRPFFARALEYGLKNGIISSEKLDGIRGEHLPVALGNSRRNRRAPRKRGQQKDDGQAAQSHRSEHAAPQGPSYAFWAACAWRSQSFP